MDNYQTILVNKEQQVVTITLNRPDVHNALDDIMIQELYDAFKSYENDDDCRVIVLTGNGKSFCAGADLKWMKNIIKYSFEQNLQESIKLAELMQLIFNHSKPVIAKVNGNAFGGGIGLFAACDIAIAVVNAKFAFTEVKIGLVPAVISPFIIYRTNINKAKELFLTGEVILAPEANRIGLVNSVSSINDIDEIVQNKIRALINNSPNAIKQAKELVYKNTQLEYNELKQYTSELISSLRTSPEGQEGMNAFFEKRKPFWIKD